MGRGASLAGALLPGVVAGIAWFLAGSRLMYRLGADDTAIVVGVFTGAAVALLLVRWGADDAARARRARLACPRCAGRLETTIAHATLGGHRTALREWRCAVCGYQHAEALTGAEEGP